MKEIIGKTYQRMGSTTGDTFTVKSMEGEFVIFTNGARLKLTSLLSDFTIAGTDTSALNESNINSVNTPDVNPDTFFTTPTNTGAIDQIEQLAKNPNAVIESDKARSSINLNTNNDTTPRSNERQMNTPSDLANRLSSNNENINAAPYEGPIQPTNRMPEWDIFDRVKKTEDIELNVVINIKLPKARHIESINDMYETSFSAYLAKQCINDTAGLQMQIKAAIEDWMNEELDTPTTSKKKTIKGKKTTTKGTSKKTNSQLHLSKTKLFKEELTSRGLNLNTTASKSDDASSFFNTNNSTWDGNVDKLIMINTPEQYSVIKKRLTNMTEDHKDYYRFEDMILVYQDSMAAENKEETF